MNNLGSAINPIRLDNTALSHFQRCPRYYMWRHVCLLAPASSSVPYFGICLHTGLSAYLEAIMRNADDDAATDSAIAAFDDVWDVDLYETGSDRIDKNRNQKWAHRIFRQYRRSVTRQRYEPMTSEEYFEREIVPGVIWCGRRDSTGVDKLTGDPAGADFKTHGWSLPAVLDTDWIAQQYQAYMWFDDRAVWFVEHIACATKWEKEGKNGEVLPEGVAFVSPTVEYKPFLIDELKAEVRGFQDTLNRLSHNRISPHQAFPKNAPYACSYYNKLCPYFQLCNTGVKPEEDWSVTDPLAAKFIREPWNPKKDSKKDLTGESSESK